MTYKEVNLAVADAVWQQYGVECPRGQYETPMEAFNRQEKARAIQREIGKEQTLKYLVAGLLRDGRRS